MKYKSRPQARIERTEEGILFYDERGKQIGSRAYNLKNQQDRKTVYQALSSAYEANMLTEGKYTHFVRTVEKAGPVYARGDSGFEARILDSANPFGENRELIRNAAQVQEEFEKAAELARIKRALGKLEYQMSELARVRHNQAA